MDLFKNYKFLILFIWLVSLKGWAQSPTISSFAPTSATFGTIITITGTNFTGATVVNFGGASAASFNVVSSTSITAVVGLGLSGSISVTTPGGTSSLAGFTFLNTLDGLGLTNLTPPAGAYSLRLLSSTYSGPLVRLFIGSTYYDVYPDVSTQSFSANSKISAGYGFYNDSATGATPNLLSSVLASNSASIAIWYDQSGYGRDVMQSSTSLQPSIAMAGVINLKNGAPAVYFNNQKLSSAGFSNAYNSEFTLTYVAGVKNNVSQPTFVNKTSSNFSSPFDLYNSSFLYGSTSSWSVVPLSQGLTSSVGFSQWTFTANSSSGEAYRNGVANGTIATSTPINDNVSSSLIFGSRADDLSTLDGWISEFVSFNSVLSGTDRQIVEANQLNYYGIAAPTITSFTPTSAGQGNLVTITGTNLISTTGVSFGGTAATSFTVNSNTSITAIVAGSASGSVSVTTAGGTATLPSFTFIPAPTITGFSPTSAASGSTITITGTDFNGATLVTFGEAPAASFAVNSTTSITAIVGAGNSGGIGVATLGGLGSLTGFTYSPLTPPGNALSFDGANDFIQIADHPSLNYGGSSFTWEAWIKFTDSQPNYAGIIAKVLGTTKGVQLVLVGNKIAAEFFLNTSTPNAIGVANGLLGSTELNDGHWHHVALVVDAPAANLKLYVDGEAEVNVNSPLLSANIDNSANTFIGTERTLIAFYKGSIDEVRMYNSALTQSNIRADMTSTASTLPANLVSYYNFDEGTSGGSNTTTNWLIDSQSSNHGTLANFALSGSNSNWVESYSMVIPSLLVATNITSTGFTANWSAPTIGLVESYQLDVSTSSTFASFVGGYNGLNVTSLSQPVSGLTPGTTYYFRVRANKDSVSEQGGYSTISTVNTLQPPTITSFFPTMAGGGATITITGNNLADATAVTFGGTAAASFSIISNTTITAVLSTGATGNVSVTSQEGTATSSGFTFIPVPTITGFTPTTAASGTIITISGSNFTGATSVSFGGTAATSFSVDSDVSISATVSSGSSGVVSVTSPGGTATSSGFVFNPAPTITSFTPTANSSGAIVTITGTNFTGATSVTFGGTPAASFSVVSDTMITAVVALGSSGDLSVTTPGGITNSSGFIFITAPVISSFNPVTAAEGATVTILGSDFAGTTAVSFGGVPATSFAVVSNTTITAIVPANSSGAISVTTLGGTDSSQGFSLIPAPTITNFTPTLAGSGTVVIISGTNFQDVTAVSFGGIPAASFTVVSGTSISAVVGNGANGDVSVSTLGGTSSRAGFSTFSLNPMDALNLTGATPAAGAYSLRLLSSHYTGPLVRVTINNSYYDVYPDAISKIVTLTSKISARYDSANALNTGITPNLVGSVLGNNSATVAIWYDQSGYGRDVAQSIISLQPSIASAGVINLKNGVPTVYFNSNKLSSISFNNGYNAAFSLTMVAGVKNNLSNSTFVSKTTSNLPSPFDLYNSYFLYGSANSWSTLNFTKGFDDSNGFSQWTFTANSTSGAAYRNSVANGTFSALTMIVDSLNSPLVFGTRDDGVTTLDGWISEFISFNNLLSTAERVAVENSQQATYGITSPTIASFSPTVGAEGTSITISGDGLAGTTAVSFGGVAATSFTVISSTSINAIVGTGSSGDVSISSSGGSYSKSGFTFINAPIINSFMPTSTSEGGTVTITGSNFTNTTMVSFGGSLASSYKVLSDTVIQAVVGTGSSGNVSVTTSGGTITLPGFTFTGVPIITSFAPTTGDVGMIVTISGSGFNTSSTNNTVFFGATKALVVSATTSQLTVVVPTGATYAPIALLNSSSGLMAFSNQNFIPTFTPRTGSIISADFSPEVFFNTGGNNTAVAIGDLDGDGLPDLAITNFNNNSVSVLRNISTAGNVGYAGKIDFSTGNGPSSVTIGDLDGDGKQELAVTNTNSNTVSVFKNTSTLGSISFAATLDITTGTNPNAIAMGDLDGDGKSDLAVTNFGSASVSVLKNTSSIGIISYDSKLDFSTGFGPNSVAISDSDGDGLADIEVTNYNSGKIAILHNTSLIRNLSFDASVYLTTGARPNSIGSGDLDGDGKNDLVVTNYSSSTVSVFRNTGVIDTVKYADKLDFITGQFPVSVSIGDLDGDGKADLLVANGSSTSVSVFRNTSTVGTINYASKIDLTIGSNPTCIAIGDLDGDGKPDLSIGNSSNTISVILNNPLFPPTITSFTPTAAASGNIVTITGTNFISTKSVSFGGVSAASFSVVSSTTISAIPATGSSGTVSITTPAGATSLSGFVFLTVTPIINSFAPTSANVGTQVTINGANFNPIAANNSVYFGATKAVVNNATATQLTVTVPQGATYSPITVLDISSSLWAFSVNNFIPTFTSTKGSINTSYFLPKVDFAVGASPQFVAVSDVDGDGKSDLVIANSNSNTISILRNTSGSGTLTYDAKVDLTTGNTPNTVATGDLDGDGKMDLVVANKGASTISIFRNMGGSGIVSFGTKIDFTSGSTPQSITISDLDNDGRADLAVANAGSNSISVLRNISTVGEINFANKIDLATGATPQSIKAGDLDGDGRMDLAIANYSSNTLSVVRNTSSIGTISFNTKVDFTASGGPCSVVFGDLDGDGLLDLSVANILNDNISVYRNTSSVSVINFAVRVEFATGKNPTSVSIADLDGDGKGDLAATNQLNNNLSVFSNTSTIGVISYSTKVDFLTGNSPSSLAIGDMDGDGKPDLISTNGGSNINTVSVIRNNPALPPSITSFTPITSASGAAVVVTGANFTNASVVSFGGIAAASFTVVSSTSISAMVAAGASGEVSVTTPGGTATKSGFTFIAAPTIISFSPMQAGVGTSISISGTGFSGTTTVNFGSVAATSFAVVSATTIIAVVPINAGGTIKITSPGGSVSASGFVFIPAPVITSFTPTSAGAGATITVTGINLTGATSLTIGGIDATSFNVVSDATITAVVGSGGSGSISVGTTGGIGTLAGFTYLSSTPIITSITPAAATVGSTVTITGFRFNTNAIGNVVFFGATRATVTAATASSITVTVPPGATYAPVTVLNTAIGLIAYSSTNFTPIFTPSKGAITKYDFSAKIDFKTGSSPQDVAAGDLDGDGLVDLAIINNVSNTVSVFRNTASSEKVSYADKIDFATGSGPNSIAIGDLDGDGKTDLAVANSSSNTVSLYKNIGSTGTISFGTSIDIITGANPQSVSIGDLDGDGKADLAITNGADATVSVLLNTGSVGIVRYANKVDFATGSNPFSAVIGDLDSDGNSDIAIANNASNTISVLRNVGNIGTVNFAPKTDFEIGSAPYTVTVGDLDSDGKLDLAVTNSNSNTVSVLLNTSVSGTVNYAKHVDFKTSDLPTSLALGDLDGDGMVDLAVSNASSNTVSILRNTSAKGTISLADKVDFATATSPLSTVIGDLDGDGKPDLAIANFGSGTVSIIRNNPVFGVIKTDQTITFEDLADKLVTDAFSLVATASSGLAVSFASANDKVTINGNQAALVNAGRATITASQVGNDSYNAATSISKSFCIKPAKPTITVSKTNANQLTSSSSAGNQWFKNGIIITGATNATYAATQAGSYRVQVKFDDCASEFSDEHVQVVTGDIETWSENNIEIYPIPSSDWISVMIGNDSLQKQLTVLDLMGRSIFTQKFSGTEVKLDVSAYLPGVYYLKVVSGNINSVKRFIVQ